MPPQPLGQVKALTFDVFGTVVDWRGSLIRAGEALGRALGVTVDWARFADDWRAGYGPAMDRVRRGELPWTRLDALHRMILDDLLVRYNLTFLDEASRVHLNTIWHRLDPWPDSIPGLTRLRSRYIVATLSNGNVALLVHMAKHAGLPWDCILSAELARHYKPNPEVYLKAAELLDLRPEEILMVAAHNGDLAAARSVGFRTAFVARPLEHGPGQSTDLAPDADVDLAATDFLDLADQLL
ncbi:haloacid dehalogenase type II [Litorilinea aerophila]|uniref:Haloacid dehalogenase type II n=1 Tax=Litorilinea aerophila TaxID=1204385 RepID=A0A540VG32_9CHLR|nr:haloacid dehalogenase type II [Litorilinea aerophila]MCC9076720.1 haloacid dehalogenase type II [Litorilinea aerophila]OUC05955.1 haloacid dehalogenase [Litorilinea aerophila]